MHLSARGLAIVGLAVLLSGRGARAEDPRPLPFAGGVLPTRRPDASALRARAERIARALSPGGGEASAPPFSLQAVVSRAEALSASGRLDESAALYDVAIEQGTRAPFDVTDPAALVQALVARATIALARGEAARADELLGRALRWDPTLALAPAEDAPRVRAVFDRVRGALGARPALERGDLGEACAARLVARRADEATTQLLRVEGCRVRAAVLAGDAMSDAAIVEALGGPVATPPRRTPVHKRPGLWVGLALGVAAVAAGVGVGVWAATRSDDAMAWNVTPRF